jgi:hypothetical protein
MIDLLHQIDRWTTRPSEIFPEYLEIVKTRKVEDPITIHVNQEEGKVRKFAGRSLYNPKIQKEADVWDITLDVFGVDDEVSVGVVRQLKPDPSRGWEEVKYLEMPYRDAKRVSKFYENAFGWGMQYLPKMGKYVLATTSPTDRKGMHKKKGAINGGFYPRGKEATSVHFVLSVDNLEKHMEIVKKAGGKVLGKPMDIPGIGVFAMFKDTEGNKVGMLQPS